jgi:hypothetical protein
MHRWTKKPSAGLKRSIKRGKVKDDGKRPRTKIE